MTEPFVQARHYYPGRRKPIRAVVVHCTASPDSHTGAEAVARYFQTTDRDASAHTVVDSNSTVNCVREGDTAWHAKGMNSDGLGLELVGQATQTEAQWLDPFSKATLERGAVKVAEWCKRYSIPARYLTADQIRDGKTKGITFHVDVDHALPSTGHTDPGPHFPRAYFLERVKAHLAPPPRVLYLTSPMMHGPDVEVVARWLTAHGFPCGTPVDIFGPQMSRAVRAFQKRHPKELRINGRFGPLERHVAGL